MKALKALIAMFAGASFLLALGACNTMEGAGKDVKAAGGKVESEAKENKKY
jgi:predicted small secreted protein